MYVKLRVIIKQYNKLRHRNFLYHIKKKNARSQTISFVLILLDFGREALTKLDVAK